MKPTEQEGTVAVDAAARWLYEATRPSTFPTPTFEQIGAMAQNSLREQMLPLVWAALEALPDRRQGVLDVLAAQDPEPETFLMWDDDGIRVVCERRECMTRTPSGPRNRANEELFSWWRGPDLPYRLTPAQAAAAVAEHVATHTEETP